jgi:hypothetical protein
MRTRGWGGARQRPKKGGFPPLLEPNLAHDTLVKALRMAQAQVAAPPKEGVPPINVWILPVAAAWIVPGLGHFLLKKRGRAALLFASIALMFLFGLFMRGVMFTPEKGADYLTSLINYGGFACDMASGAFYLCASIFGYSQPDMPGDVHDYGSKFLVTAGLLNILAMVDAFEIAAKRRD